MNACLAYFITFSCYGARLHGDGEGSVHRTANLHGTPPLPANARWRNDAFKRQEEATLELDVVDQKAVLEAILEVCKFREWEALAVHVRSNHVHAIVHALEKPERVMNDFKSFSTRRLKKHEEHTSRERFWSRHGSTRYLWSLKDVELAMHYVIHEQGEPLALFSTTDVGSAMGRIFERLNGCS